MQRLFMFFIVFISIFSLSAQSNGGCGTVAPSSYQHYLSVQERSAIHSAPSASRTGIRWMPVWYHIVAKNDGTGGSGLKNILITHCEMNQIYNTFDMGFYIAGIDTIMDTDLWIYQTVNNYYAFQTYNPNYGDVINIYINGNLPGLCGVSTFPNTAPNGGGIFLYKGCIGAGTKTMEHEMGHYFNLLHTFETWQGTEFVDGSNCASAGDGFCDTPADCVNYRSGCPYTGTTTDAHGDLYNTVVDPTFSMSYFNDNCGDRFSNQEQAEMNSTLTNNFQNLLNHSAPDVSALSDAVFISPVNGDTTVFNTNVIFQWNSIPGAMYYEFIVKNGGTTVRDTVIIDTLYVIPIMQANAYYTYKVKGIYFGNTCGNSATLNSIRTSVIRANTTTVLPCIGTSTGIINASPSNGIPPYTFNWSTGATTSSISNVATGSYSVTITDSTGAVASGTINLGNPVPVSGHIDQVGFNLNAYGTGGTAPYTYQWSNGVNGQFNNAVPIGNYSVTITDAHGCSGILNYALTATSSLANNTETKVVMKIFPNPASSYMNLQIALNEKAEGTVDVLNVNGEIIREVKKEFVAGANNLQMNIELLPSGIYFIQFRSNNALKTERISIIR